MRPLTSGVTEPDQGSRHIWRGMEKRVKSILVVGAGVLCLKLQHAMIAWEFARG
jgi:hypothetical protein